MRKRPPHIVVTTPESFYILLTSEGGRQMLATTRTVIVDELHAVTSNKRGAHLALSLERLDLLAGRRVLHISLSATQRPIEELARLRSNPVVVEEPLPASLNRLRPSLPIPEGFMKGKADVRARWGRFAQSTVPNWLLDHQNCVRSHIHCKRH